MTELSLKAWDMRDSLHLERVERGFIQAI